MEKEIAVFQILVSVHSGHYWLELINFAPETVVCLSRYRQIVMFVPLLIHESFHILKITIMIFHAFHLCVHKTTDLAMSLNCPLTSGVFFS